jgi:hypothetical protein
MIISDSARSSGARTPAEEERKMQSLFIRETPDYRYSVESAIDEMPPRLVSVHSTLEEALASQNVEWEPFVAEDDGDCGDVVYIYTFPS